MGKQKETIPPTVDTGKSYLALLTRRELRVLAQYRTTDDTGRDTIDCIADLQASWAVMNPHPIKAVPGGAQRKGGGTV